MSSGFDFITDTHFMCCICFDTVRVGSAWVCPHGDTWDTCVPCGDNNGCEHLIHTTEGD